MPNKYKKKYNITKEFILTNFEAGKTCKEISKDIGCSYSLIYTFCKNNNIEIPQLNLLGKKWGWFEVISYHGSNGVSKLWECRCKCGNIRIYPTKSITREENKSCGCYLTSEERCKSSYLWKGYGDIRGKWWGNIKRGALKRGYVFEITIQEAWELFLKQNKKCSLTGLDIYFGKNNRTACTASLDRINNNLGYTIDNVHWVHKDVNYMKQGYTLEYFLETCILISNNIGKNNVE